MEEKKILAGIKLTIGTPLGSGRPDVQYIESFTNTTTLLTHFGADVRPLWLAGVADLPAARARLLGAFLRTDDTHFLMIDDDMGWDAADVLRMLLLKRDFLAAVGCKKKDPKKPLEFCFNVCDEHGKEKVMMIDADGIIEVSEVGAAFVLLSRDCAQKMVDHYRDSLSYSDDMGHTEVSVFEPFIIPGTKRRLGEDYAFCYRWRKIGGKVEVMPEVKLQHVGRYIWEGALIESLIPQGG